MVPFNPLSHPPGSPRNMFGSRLHLDALGSKRSAEPKASPRSIGSDEAMHTLHCR